MTVGANQWLMRRGYTTFRLISGYIPTKIHAALSLIPWDESFP